MKTYRDHYFLKAKRENYPARSVYKLKEMDARFRLLKPGMKVLDLGAAPGSWSLYAAERVGASGHVLGCDLQTTGTVFPANVTFLQENVFERTEDFERLLDDYFDSGLAQKEGLPTVKYFADKVCLSANYFGDMIRRQTGQTASEYIQRKIIGRAKEYLLSSDMTMSQIAYELGFQYPQHMSRMFKRVAGCTPNEFRNRQ